MLCIPSLQFSIRHPDELMSNSSVFLVHNALLTNCITPPFRNEIDPEVVVDSAEGNTGDESVVSGKITLLRYLHPDACYAISCVEEAHRACVDTSLWWNPRHDQKKNFDQDEQADCDIPGFELGPLDPELAALTSNQIYSNGHGEEEYRFWIILEIDH
jgi:hypothetical protein